MGGKPLAGVGDGHLPSQGEVRQGSYGYRTLANALTVTGVHIGVVGLTTAGEEVAWTARG
jgi:hypothetical protein